MYLKIHSNGDLSLEETDNFKAFSIRDETEGLKSERFHLMAQPAEENHFWLDAKTLIDLGEKADDDDWKIGFKNMMKAVEQYGYSDLHNNRIKAHLE